MHILFFLYTMKFLKVWIQEACTGRCGNKTAFSYHLHAQLSSLLEVMNGNRGKMENLWIFFLLHLACAKKLQTIYFPWKYIKIWFGILLAATITATAASGNSSHLLSSKSCCFHKLLLEWLWWNKLSFPPKQQRDYQKISQNFYHLQIMQEDCGLGLNHSKAGKEANRNITIKWFKTAQLTMTHWKKTTA